MKEQFVTYEIAKKLKELGFNEQTGFAHYDKLNNNLLFFHPADESVNYEDDRFIYAPLWQQVIDWFDYQNICISTPRIRHNFEIFISENGVSLDYFYNKQNKTFKTRMKANEYGILEVIRLIKRYEKTKYEKTN